MASAARAYAVAEVSRRQGAPLRVVAGGRGSSALSPQIVFAAKVFMVALAVLAVVSCVRIGLASATVTTTIATEQISATVDDIRSGSAHLEVTESSLANPATVKSTASSDLGMKAPEEVGTITLEPDVVAYDEAGNLSLARSLSAAMQG